MLKEKWMLLAQLMVYRAFIYPRTTAMAQSFFRFLTKKGNVLVSFSENYIQDNGVFCNIIRHNPAFLKKNSSYALVDGMLDYYLNQKKFAYLSNGWRNIYHETEFHDYLISVFGYAKEYLLLHIKYSRKFDATIRMAYPFRNIIWYLSNKWANNTLNKIGAVLKQEHIRQTCKNQISL